MAEVVEADGQKPEPGHPAAHPFPDGLVGQAAPVAAVEDQPRVVPERPEAKPALRLTRPVPAQGENRLRCEGDLPVSAALGFADREAAVGGTGRGAAHRQGPPLEVHLLPPEGE